MRVTLCIVGVLALLLTAPIAEAKRWRSVNREQASGYLAFALIEARAKRPQQIKVQVTSEPAQLVNGSWSLSCKRNRQQTGFRAASFQEQTPHIEKLRSKPRRSKRCKMHVFASLADPTGEGIFGPPGPGWGKLAVEVFAKQR